MTYYETKMKINGSWVTVGPSKTEFDSKLTKNASVTGATKCKITYDANGLVTAGEDLTTDDVPSLASKKITAMTDYARASAKSAIAVTDSLNVAMGKLEYKVDNILPTATNGQMIRYNATTSAWEAITLPASMYIRSPSTGDEIGAITPAASINGEMRYCTADGTTHTTFKAGNFYLCTSNDGTTYSWYSLGSFIDLTDYQLKSVGKANKDKVLISDADGDISVSSVTSTELAYLSGVTSSLQTQLDAKTSNTDVSPTSATIGTTWTQSGIFYVQDVTFTGMTSSDNPIISVIYDGTTTDAINAQMTAASKIVKIESAADKLTVYATEATTTALTILVRKK